MRKRVVQKRAKKLSHPFLSERGMSGAFIVMRLDDYGTTPVARGQFYPIYSRDDDKSKAVWPSEEQANSAAEWAIKQFGHTYGIFKLITVLEPADVPVRKVSV